MRVMSSLELRSNRPTVTSSAQAKQQRQQPQQPIPVATMSTNLFPTQRKGKHMRRIHNLSVAVFAIVICFIIFFPLPKQRQLSLLNITQRNFTSQPLAEDHPQHPSSFSSVLSRSTIITQLNQDRSLPKSDSNSNSNSNANQTPNVPTNSNTSTSTKTKTTDSSGSQTATDISNSTTISTATSTTSSNNSSDQSSSSVSTKPLHESKSIFDEQIGTPTFPFTNEKYVVIRAIGNDLPPRHAIGQSYNNLKFILENEPNLPNLDKRWYLNRIVNKTEQTRIVQLLGQHKQRYIIDEFNHTHYYQNIDFRLKTYFKQYDILRSHYFSKRSNHSTSNSKSEIERLRAWDIIFEPKNQYIIHNNQARNNMLHIGKVLNATYILPWDGNCFLNVNAWSNITNSISNISLSNNSNTAKNYFYVPMSRIKDNDVLVNNQSYIPNSLIDEPQIIFHKLSNATFDETKPYGYRPKVDLLWRLKIPDFQFKHKNGTILKDTMPWKYVKDIPGYDSVQPVGWTARLFSGNKQLEQKHAASLRGASRSDGIELIAAYASLSSAQQISNYSRLYTTMIYNRKSIRNLFSSPPRIDAVQRAFQLVNHSQLVGLPAAPPSTVHIQNVSNIVKSTTSKLANYLISLGICLQHSDTYSVPQTAIDQSKLAILSWFVNKNTLLQPSSVSDVETLIHLSVALDGIKLLHSSSIITADEMEKITEWTTEMTSKLNEFETNNTHNVWKDIYFSKNRYAVLYEIGISCIASFAGEFHTTLRHTGLTRLRLHESIFSNNSKTSTKRVRDIVPWILLSSISQRIGIDIWHYGVVIHSKNKKNKQKTQSKLVLLQNNINLALKQAQLVQSNSEVKIASWIEAIARKIYGDSFNEYQPISQQRSVQDDEIIRGGKDFNVDDVIPPYFIFAFDR